MDKFFEINQLEEIYGELLTESQKKVIDLYYSYDCSLNEIATQLEISKQAVSLNLKRAEKALYKYEQALGLLKEQSEKISNEEVLKDLFKKLRQNSKAIDEITLTEIENRVLKLKEV